MSGEVNEIIIEHARTYKVKKHVCGEVECRQYVLWINGVRIQDFDEGTQEVHHTRGESFINLIKHRVATLEQALKCEAKWV